MSSKRKKAKMLFKDSGGNTLWEKKLADNTYQWYAKNKQGRLVDESGVRTMMHRAGFKYRKNRRK